MKRSNDQVFDSTTPTKRGKPSNQQTENDTPKNPSSPYSVRKEETENTANKPTNEQEENDSTDEKKKEENETLPPLESFLTEAMKDEFERGLYGWDKKTLLLPTMQNYNFNMDMYFEKFWEEHWTCPPQDYIEMERELNEKIALFFSYEYFSQIFEEGEYTLFDGIPLSKHNWGMMKNVSIPFSDTRKKGLQRRLERLFTSQLVFSNLKAFIMYVKIRELFILRNRIFKERMKMKSIEYFKKEYPQYEGYEFILKTLGQSLGVILKLKQEGLQDLTFYIKTHGHGRPCADESIERTSSYDEIELLNFKLLEKLNFCPPVHFYEYDICDMYEAVLDGKCCKGEFLMFHDFKKRYEENFKIIQNLGDCLNYDETNLDSVTLSIIDMLSNLGIVINFMILADVTDVMGSNFGVEIYENSFCFKIIDFSSDRRTYLNTSKKLNCESFIEGKWERILPEFKYAFSTRNSKKRVQIAYDFLKSNDFPQLLKQADDFITDYRISNGNNNYKEDIHKKYLQRLEYYLESFNSFLTNNN